MPSTLLPSPYAVGQKVRAKLNGQLVTGSYAGWSEKYRMPLVEIEGKIKPRKIFSLDEVAADPALIATVVPHPESHPETTLADINQRFQYVEQLVSMVAKGPATSLVVTGPGGLGKSHTVFSRLIACGLAEERDFITIKGYSTSKALFRTLWENRDGKVLVFDDCDSVLEHKTSVNILKSALDTFDVRKVAWNSDSSMEGDSDLPRQFDFSGKVIFISNWNLTKIPQPILSRAFYVDLSMTADEKLARIKTIAGQLKPDMHESLHAEVLDFLNRLKSRITDLNIRTFLKVSEIRVSAPDCWQGLAEYVVTAQTAA